MTDTILHDLRLQLQQHSDAKNREGAKRYFKEPIQCYGIKTMINTLISKEFFKTIKAKPKSEIFDLCEELWKSGMLEESFIAGHWAYMMRKQFEPQDFKRFEYWVDSYISNWANCDNFCNHALGDFVMMFPEYVQEFKRWTRSSNRWMRRAAAVSLIVPARKGLFLMDIFDIADRMLTDRDDLVQKGYGWMLKAASQAYPQEVFDFVVARKDRMPRTAYRYAIEKLTPAMREKAMEK